MAESQDPARDQPDAGSRIPSLALLGLLIAVFALRLGVAAEHNTLTPDEPHYIGKGLYLWHSGDYDYRRTLVFHPPMAFHLASLPLLAIDLERGGPREITREIGAQLLSGEDPDPRRVRWLSRLPFVALSCWGAILAFLWAREAVGGARGERAGLLAALLYTASPSMLAYSGLAHTDVTVTVFILQTLYCFWRWSREPGWLRFALCGVSLGLALLSKASALLVLPSIGLILLAMGFRLTSARRGDFSGIPRSVVPGIVAAAQWTGLLLIACATLWVGYGGSFAMSEGMPGAGGGVRLPWFAHSVLFDVAANEQSRAIYFAGEIAEDGRFWYLLPLAWFLKTPIAIWILLALALSNRSRVGGADPGVSSWFLALPAAVFLATVVFWLRVPLGVRYLLPVVPLLHVFVATRILPLQTRLRRGVALASLVWLVLAGAFIHPHYLAYFNELIGGPARADRLFVESNLDWGQDLQTLADELAARGNPEVWLAYFGSEPPERYGIRARKLQGCRPVEGLVAISVNVLRGLYSARNPMLRPPPGCYDWLLARDPVARPGYSILLYEIPRRRESMGADEVPAPQSM